MPCAAIRIRAWTASACAAIRREINRLSRTNCTRNAAVWRRFRAVCGPDTRQIRGCLLYTSPSPRDRG
eukprot:215285-Rhodomonas_salina.3